MAHEQTFLEYQEQALMSTLRLMVDGAEIYGKSIEIAYMAFREAVELLEKNGLFKNAKEKAEETIRRYELEDK